LWLRDYPKSTKENDHEDQDQGARWWNCEVDVRRPRLRLSTIAQALPIHHDNQRKRIPMKIKTKIRGGGKSAGGSGSRGCG